MDLFGRKRITQLEAQFAQAQREAREDRIQANRTRTEMESRIQSLEDAVKLLITKIKPTDLETLAREMISQVQPAINESTGELDHSARIMQAFLLARAWVAERDK